jgi:hypothetical protein
MPSLTTSNLMLWDDLSKVNFSKEIANILPYINWKETIWQTFGLPIEMATYSLVGGKSLYLETLPDGVMKIEKQYFTGEITASVLFLDKNNLGVSHYIVSCALTFFKGELEEVKIVTETPLDKDLYERNFKSFEDKYKKNIKLRTSWAFVNLYRPYKKTMQLIFRVPIGLFTLGRWGSICVLRLLTPL